MRIPRLGILAASLALYALAALAPPMTAAPKTLSGKLRAVHGDRLTVQKSNLFGVSNVEVEMTTKTKVHGQLAPGMHVKIKYREEKSGDSRGHAGKEKAATRRIATEIEAWPEFATKSDRKAAKDSQP